MKAVEDMFAPISGEVFEVNQSVIEDPEALQNDPHGKGWLLLVKPDNPEEFEKLMDSKTYSGKIASN